MAFGAFQILFSLFFLVVLGMFVFTAIRGIGQWNRNNQSPRLTVTAQVVTKRSNHHHSVNHTSSTSYYVTFQVASGDRMEFSVSGREYGMLAEGDTGELSFQRTRYLGFTRT